ncbi:hypothetical protein Nizo2259_1744 [Lactiplantibacillus plantarum]|uniref:Uncharacterized protein n=1 Tax=Lactiplantibacillus plantarum TaxID=1590 RepID=A0A165QNI2_LACPN|nr:Hypothetical protein zj316_2514 [Lactiplantibacillus plantarum ZJ316]AGL64884.2 hypothetical protein LBP_cg2138 [Lactiplantibacillus plantarum subsp. plantarum P-8]ASL80564.1 hypothetical protein GBLP1_g2080 [Lactiplantibacillus plantarum]EMP42774.1 Hypothetical protein H073_14733 [Lactiplantibacillus plantarum UCMA 3037]EPD24634.1 Hypothetical protein L103_06761 [Lactiplantibacillus plantarum IPLA88]
MPIVGGRRKPTLAKHVYANLSFFQWALADFIWPVLIR